MCFILTVKLIHCLLWLLFFSSLNVPLHFLSCRKNASSSYAISKKWYDFCDDSFVIIIHAFFKVFPFFYRKQSTGKFYIQIVQSFPWLQRENQSLTCCLVYQQKPVHYFQIPETGPAQALNGTPVSTRKMEVSSFFFLK